MNEAPSGHFNIQIPGSEPISISWLYSSVGTFVIQSDHKLFLEQYANPQNINVDSIEYLVNQNQTIEQQCFNFELADNLNTILKQIHKE